MLHKACHEIELKADGDSGDFTALVSVFDNVDRVGDRVMRGAFTKTLAEWREKGDPIPVVLSHNWDDPYAHIGIADPQNVKQTARGLVVKGKLDIGDNAVARQVHRLMKRRSLKAFSFGYRVHDSEVAEDGVNELKEIELFEVGPTLVGANQSAELQAVKSALAAETDEEEVEETPPAEEPAPPAEEKKDRDELSRRILEAQLRARGIPVGEGGNQ